MSPAAASSDKNWTDCGGADLPPAGTIVPTACGGTIRYRPDTPCISYRGETVYFCLPVCKTSFEENPRYSCLIGYVPDP
jgi:YHS domain-containing protein